MGKITAYRKMEIGTLFDEQKKKNEQKNYYTY